MQVLADGIQDGVRWWLQRVEGDAMLHITVSGIVGSNRVIDCGQLATADPAALDNWRRRLLAKKRAGWKRNAAAAAAAPETTAPPIVTTRVRTGYVP